MKSNIISIKQVWKENDEIFNDLHKQYELKNNIKSDKLPLKNLFHKIIFSFFSNVSMATFIIDLVVSFLHGLIWDPLVGPNSLSVECYLLPEMNMRKFLKIFKTVSSCGFSKLDLTLSECTASNKLVTL